MKHNNSFYYWVSICLLGLFTGCLKDDDVKENRLGNNPDENLRIVEISGPVRGFYGVDLVATNSDTVLQQFTTIRLASEEPLDHDIQVTLVADPTVVSAYNSTYGTSYVVPAAGLYSVASWSVTIPKGERLGYLKLTTRASNLLGSEYALGIRIASVSDAAVTISGNYGKQVVSFAIRNKYDGRYTVTGTMVDLTNAALTGKYPFDANLETVSANSAILYHRGSPFTGYYHPILNGSSVSAYGNFAPIFVFDANNNVVAMDNGYGQGAGSRWAVLDPTGINKYDPATKILRVRYTMNQPSAGTVRTKFDETWTYTGAR